MVTGSECLTQSLAVRKWTSVSACESFMCVWVSVSERVSCPVIWLAFLQLTLFLSPWTPSSEPSFSSARVSFRKPRLCESQNVWAIFQSHNFCVVQMLPCAHTASGVKCNRQNIGCLSQVPYIIGSLCCMCSVTACVCVCIKTFQCAV